MIKSYIAKNQIQNAMALLDKMEQCNVMPDVTIFGELFCALDLTKDRDLVSILFEKMKHFDIQLDTPLFNLFLKRKKEIVEDVNNRARQSRDNPLASIQMALDIIAHMRTHNLQPDARYVLLTANINLFVRIAINGCRSISVYFSYDSIEKY